MAAKTKTAQPQQAFDKVESFKFKVNPHYTDPKFCARAAKLRDDGASWDEVAEELGVNRAVASLSAKIHELGPIPFRNEKELVQKIVKARDQDSQAWAIIGARAGGLTEGRVESLYTETTGTDHTESYIGRGGRPRNDGRGYTPAASDDKPKPKAKKATKKATTKKAGATRKPKAKKPNFGDEPTKASVAKALEGKTVTVKKGTGTAEFEITDVQIVKQAKSGRWGAKVTTSDGAERTFPLDSVQAVA